MRAEAIDQDDGENALLALLREQYFCGEGDPTVAPPNRAARPRPGARRASGGVWLGERGMRCLRVLLPVATLTLGCLGTPTPLAPGLGGSVGLPHHGVLTDAVELKDSGPGFVRYRPQGAYHWGTPELVSLVEQAAASVDQAFGGGPPLVVGDLSGKRGGRIERHQSHRTGRDVDLLFYVTMPAGVPVRSPGFLKFGYDGLAEVEPPRKFVRFDVPRNWQLVKALVSSGTAPVQRIYVSRALEALLIDYALARVEDPTLVWRAESVLFEPGDSGPHDDHFHLRVACTPERAVAGCDGGGPVWEWLPNPLEFFSTERVSEDSSAETGYFNPLSPLGDPPILRGPA